MLFSITAPTAQIQKSLQAAREKLLAANVPQLLRVTGFLRLSCLTLEEPGAYSELLQKLCEYPCWWTLCDVTPAGTLESTNPQISRLLAPINALHYPQTQEAPRQAA